ncbi:MAG: hypothetical protein ACF8OB_19010 [Phycisphaeraceae bacterium JB051]
MSRKDRIAPFEVMRSGRDQRERAQSATEPVAEKPIPDESENQEQPQQAVFEPTSSGPLVLRIPKGYAALAALILVGLFVLTYWVGYSRGDKDRLAKVRELAESQQEMYNRTALLAATGQSTASGSGAASSTSTQNNSGKSVTENMPVVYTTDNPPQKYRAGHNYFVLVHYPPKEATELVEFLGQHGVDAAAIFVNNKRFKVVALEGFLASELDSQRAREYKQLLRRLGRLWQDSKRGAGDLSDMYPERYDGPKS